MEKKDWRQQQQHKSARQRKSATSPVDGGGSPTDSSGLSPLGDRGLAGDGMEYAAANAHQPEMDEMRCLLWAHGGPSIHSLHCIILAAQFFPLC